MRTVPQALEQDAEPRHDAQYQDRDEVVGRAIAVMNLAGEALELFVDKKELREFRVFQRDQHEPWRRDEEEQDQAQYQMQALPDRPVARKQGVQHQYRAGQEQADQAFRQYRQRHASPAQKHPVTLFAMADVAALCQQQGAQGNRHHAGQAHVQRVDVAKAGPQEAGAKHQRRIETDARGEHAGTGERHQRHAQQAAQTSPQTCLPFTQAKQLERECIHPGLQRWFLKVFEAIQP